MIKYIWIFLFVVLSVIFLLPMIIYWLLNKERNIGSLNKFLKEIYFDLGRQKNV